MSNQKNKLYLKIAILALSLLSILFALIRNLSLGQFVGFAEIMQIYPYVPIIVAIIVALYEVFLAKSSRANVWLGGIFILLAILSFLGLFNANDLMYDTETTTYFAGFTVRLTALMCGIVISALFVISSIASYKKSSKKLFPILSASAGIALSALTAISLDIRISNNIYCQYMKFSAFIFIMLNIALILICIESNIQTIETPAHASNVHTSPATITTLTPEQQLSKLKDLYDLGIISEEEYKSKKADIIKNL